MKVISFFGTSNIYIYLLLLFFSIGKFYHFCYIWRTKQLVLLDLKLVCIAKELYILEWTEKCQGWTNVEGLVTLV